jgi:hypothetical protein
MSQPLVFGKYADPSGPVWLFLVLGGLAASSIAAFCVRAVQRLAPAQRSRLIFVAVGAVLQILLPLTALSVAFALCDSIAYAYGVGSDQRYAYLIAWSGAIASGLFFAVCYWRRMQRKGAVVDESLFVDSISGFWAEAKVAARKLWEESMVVLAAAVLLVIVAVVGFVLFR